MYAYDSQQWSKLKENRTPRCSFLDSSPFCEVYYRWNQELLSLSVVTFFLSLQNLPFSFFRLALHFNLMRPPLNCYENNTVFLHNFCGRTAHEQNIYGLICISDLAASGIFFFFFKINNRQISSDSTKLRIAFGRMFFFLYT